MRLRPRRVGWLLAMILLVPSATAADARERAVDGLHVKSQAWTSHGEPNPEGAGLVFWVVPTAGAILLAVAGAGGYLVWRRLREIRQHVLETVRAQEEVRRGLGLVAETLEAIADTARNHLLVDLEHRLETVQRALGADAGGKSTGLPAPHLVIVRRGETELFGALQAHLEQAGSVRVIWDRRVGQRRTDDRPPARERRQGDRRGPLPVLWATHGLVLADPRAGAGPLGPPGAP